MDKNKKDLRVAFYGGIADYYMPPYAFGKVLETHRILIDYEKPDLLVFDAVREWRKGLRRHPDVPSIMFSGENVSVDQSLDLRRLSPAHYLFSLYQLKRFIPNAIKRLRLYRVFVTGYVWLSRCVLCYANAFALIAFVRAFLLFIEKNVDLRLLRYAGHLIKYLSYQRRCHQGGPYHLITAHILPPRSQGFSFPILLYEIIDLRRKKNFRIEKPLPSNPKRPFFAITVISNYHAYERLSFFYRLSQYRPVLLAGGGRSKHFHAFRGLIYKMANQDITKPLPLPPVWRELLPVYAKYKFVMCFENSSAVDYITDKLLMALLSGAIPIYWGAPNIGDYFNTDRFVHYKGSFGAMIKQVKALDQDDAAYAAMCAQPIVKPAHMAYHQKKWRELYAYMDDLVKKIGD